MDKRLEKPANLHDEVWHLVIRLVHQERQRMAAVIAELGLTAPQAEVLRRLVDVGPQPMNELASTLGCDASNVTGIVDRLEARALVERTTDPADRRVKRIALTTAGSELHHMLLKRFVEAPEAIRGLDATTLRAARDFMRAALGSSADEPLESTCRGNR